MNEALYGYNLPGTKLDDFFKWEKEKQYDKKGPFEIEENIQYQLRKDPYNLQNIYDLPSEQNPLMWQYEHMRQFLKEFNALVAVLDGHCTRESCPIMKATDEWVYLCAAHKSPKECCAFEYAIHTLDSTNAIVCSSKVFPSRVSIPSTAPQYFQSIARRVYRIFSHAYFHHKEIFTDFEEATNLCHRFVYFTQKFDLIPKSLLIIPDTMG